MAARRCKNWLETYMKYSSFSEAPDTFHFWTGVSVLAGALRRRVWIDMGYFQWTPNFYIVFVSPPGIVQKSTTASIGMNLLKQIKAVKFGPDAVTWQSLVESLAKSTESITLPSGDMIPQSAITIVSSEFGTFLNPNDREMVDVLVSLWDGQLGTWEKATKTQGRDSVQNPWINIIACTTPAWIADNFPEYMIGGGFMSRTIFVYGDEKRHLIAYPSHHMSKEHVAIREDLIADLEIISSEMVGEYKLSPEATKLGVEWYESHYKTRNQQFDDERFMGYVARKQTHVHKIAMILAAATKNELVIEKHELEQALQLAQAIEQDMPKIFSKIVSEEVKHSNKIVNLVSSRGQMPTSEAYQRLFAVMSYTDFLDGVKSAVQGRRLMQVRVGNELMLKAVFRTNG